MLEDFPNLLYNLILSPRLWIIPKDDLDSPEAQQIGYVNIVPCRNEYGVFDSFGDTVKKFNVHLRHRPLPGMSGQWYILI